MDYCTITIFHNLANIQAGSMPAATQKECLALMSDELSQLYQLVEEDSDEHEQLRRMGNIYAYLRRMVDNIQEKSNDRAKREAVSIPNK